MRLHHVIEGPDDAPALVLLCSLGSTVDMWAPQRRELVGDGQRRGAGSSGTAFRVITMDTRGHGGSPVPDGPYRVDDLARDVLETLDELGVARASFAGVSLGGAIALWLGRHAPERVRTLAPICSSACFPNPETFRERATTVRERGTAAVADAVVERWFTETFAKAEPETVRRMRDMIASTPAEGYASCCEAVADWDVRDELGGIAAPTLVIGGAEDPVATPDHQRLLGERLPDARVEILPDAAHLASFQRPEVVTPLLAAHAEGAR